MPRNPTTGVFTRVNNSFSEPVSGTIIDPDDADDLFADYDSAFNTVWGVEPVSVTGATGTVAAGTAAIAIVRAAPTATTINLPTVASQNGQDLVIQDWSTGVLGGAADHVITITPNGAETIGKGATYPIVSNTSQLASVTLRPSTSLSGWMIV